jgi:hypothetical protein
MKVKSTIGIAIPLFFLFASCVSQSSVTETPTLVTKAIPTNSPNATTTKNFTPTPQATFNPTQALEATEGYFRFTAIPATIEARGAKCKDGFILERDLEVLDYSSDKWTLFTCSPVTANGKDMWTPGAVDFGTRYTQLIKTDFSKTWTIQHSSFDLTKRAPDAGDSAQSQAVFYALSFFQLDGFAVPAPAQVTQTVEAVEKVGRI